MRKSGSQVTYYTLSHRGLVRENNEDRVSISELQNTDAKQALLAILADGVGGHNAGEVASRIAVDTIQSEIIKAHPAQDVPAMLEDAILSANQAILDDVAANPNRQSMGTTCVCAFILGRSLYVAHLGDSRLYLFRDGKLHLLTKDHTLFEEFQELAINHPDKITRSHPMAHVLSRYLGSTHTVHVDHGLLKFGQADGTLALQPGDKLLLCSDGISDLLAETEITEILANNSGRKQAQMLVYRALENGGHDNASVIVLNIP